jgi:general secretion pathway protein F
MFAHLAAMEKAGLSAELAFAALHLNGAQERVQRVCKLLSQGIDIASAGSRAGLFTVLETRLVRAACCAGSPAITYQRLAARYQQQVRLVSSMKTKIAMPLLILLIALLVQPLPALVSGAMNAGQYLLFVCRPFVLLAGLFLVCRFLSSRLSTPTDHPTFIQQTLTALLTRIPFVGTMLVRRNVRDFYENLALLLEAGIPMLEAVPIAVDTISLCTMRAEVRQIQAKVERGMTLTQAVCGQPIESFVQTGEGSGKLPEMLLRFVDEESETLARHQTQLAEWLPRLFYLCIVAWMSYTLL